jgi:hypothetical protein
MPPDKLIVDLFAGGGGMSVRGGLSQRGRRRARVKRKANPFPPASGVEHQRSEEMLWEEMIGQEVIVRTYNAGVFAGISGDGFGNGTGNDPDAGFSHGSGNNDGSVRHKGGRQDTSGQEEIYAHIRARF